MLNTLDVSIGQWNITKYNGIGFILALGLCFVLLLVFCGVSNVVSKNRKDPYEEENQKLVERKNYDQITKDSKVKTELKNFKHLCSNIDFLLIIISSLSVSFLANSVEILITVTSDTVAGFNITTFCIMLSACLFIYAFIIARFWNFYFLYGKEREYMAWMVCLILNLISCVLMILPNWDISKTAQGVKKLFVFMAILTNSTAGVSISGACVEMFFVHVPGHFIEGVEEFRGSIHRIFGFIGLILAGTFYNHVTYIYLAFVIFKIVLIILVHLRHKHVANKLAVIDKELSY